MRLERDPATRKDAVIINYDEAGGGAVAHREIGQSSKRLPVERRLDCGEIRRVNVPQAMIPVIYLHAPDFVMANDHSFLFRFRCCLGSLLWERGQQVICDAT